MVSSTRLQVVLKKAELHFPTCVVCLHVYVFFLLPSVSVNGIDKVEVSGEGDAAQAGADVLQAECRSELLNVRFFSGESCAPFRAAITKRSSASVTTVPTVGAPGTSVSNSPTVPADRVRYIAQGFGHWNAPSASL